MSQSQKLFSDGAVADSVTLSVISITYPCIEYFPILARCTRYTIRTILSYHYILGGILGSGQYIAIRFPTVLCLQ